MKSVIVTAIVVIVIIVIGVGFAIYFNNQNQSSGSAATGTATNMGTSTAAGRNPEPILPASQTVPDAATSSVIAIGTAQGTVNVKNFYLSNPSTTDGGETVILENNDYYMLTYSTLNSSFWIGINPDQFYAMRAHAEADLLMILGVSTTDACKLSVSEGVFYSPTATISSGQSFPLSFCSGAYGQ